MKKFLLVVIILVMSFTLVSCNNNENNKSYAVDEEWKGRLERVHGLTFDIDEGIEIINTNISSGDEFELLFKSNDAYKKGKKIAEKVFFKTEEIANGGNYDDITLSVFTELADSIVAEESERSFKAEWYYKDYINNEHNVVIEEYENKIKMIIR